MPDVQPEGTPNCFYPLPGKTCELTDLVIARRSDMPAKATRSHCARTQNGPISSAEGMQEWMTRATSKHSHNADTHIQEFYNSKEVVQLATEFLREDLERFGYPKMRWNNGQ